MVHKSAMVPNNPVANVDTDTIRSVPRLTSNAAVREYRHFIHSVQKKKEKEKTKCNSDIFRY